MGKNQKDRWHCVISDQKMEQRIRARMAVEKITFQELLEKHLVFPEEADSFIHKDYVEIEKTIAEAYDKPMIKKLMEILWILIINCAKDNYDIVRIINNIEADIRLETFKKKK